MTKTRQRYIEVHAHWVGLKQPILMGILHATVVRGKEVFSFEYDAYWLKNYQGWRIDPSLHLVHGLQYAPKDQDNFGLFLDSSPDRWGRFLMNRREAIIARNEGRSIRNLLESDYLLGVFDKQRMGALRFRTGPNGPFLDDNEKLSAPPWASLRALEQASLAIEKLDAENDPSYAKWVQMLIAPGGSLGGARPKAGVIDANNRLWIAKFPSTNDEYNVGAWEMVAHILAEKAGIKIPKVKIEKFNSQHHTFLSQRFDRTESNERLHFASAMTLLQYTDGKDASMGVSYLELAEFIVQNGEKVNEDLKQLWRRIVFYICISNVDDHLRNHGFILDSNGWSLSPVFDINPNPMGNGLKLNISDTDNSQDLSLAIEVAEYFRIKKDEADKIIHEVIASVKDWRKVASNIGLSVLEQGRMARAFRIVN